MPNRTLTTDELKKANELLREVRQRLRALAGADSALLFAYNRKLCKELSYGERGKPNLRRKLKNEKWKQQRGRCAICGQALPEKYAVLDRMDAATGYTKDNTRLIHDECDRKVQAERQFS